ncbi:hypothetical protein C6503_03995 [Candidatus Poribacteria bacterium]|nr:MAG: hypothetical protein C6503_03995 [Candidatus Poribacteria bacterium]
MMSRLRFIGFLLLVTTPLIGCGIFVNRGTRLTLNDLHMMGVTNSNRVDRYLNYPSAVRGTKRNFLSGLPVIAIFQYGGNGNQLTIQYWLLDSSATAQKAAEAAWPWLFAAPANFQLEMNPEDIVGDATWRNIHRREEGPTDIYFVKHNLLVSIRTVGQPSKDLQDARDIARHIEAKIEAVLKKK